jgi:HAD superfamily hydrolase (TIGR01509 family)
VATSARPELVIFDCDGVLVDSEHLAVGVELEILRELGWSITAEEVVEHFLGVSDDDYVAIVEEHLGGKLPPGWEEAMAPRYRAVLERDLQRVPGIGEALDLIEDAGIWTCVASSGTHDKMRLTLGLTGLSERFEGRIFSATEVERGKPAPDLFLHAAAQMEVPPERCAVVEDSPPGVAAGVAAGMRTVAYASGLVPLHRLGLEGVEVITDMSELPALLLSRNR